MKILARYMSVINSKHNRKGIHVVNINRLFVEGSDACLLASQLSQKINQRICSLFKKLRHLFIARYTLQMTERGIAAHGM
jgi:hypothetical protein